MIDWKPESEKPEAYKIVLLALAGDDFTTGHWAKGADFWIGYAYNQSPPIYRLAQGSVSHWAEINRPGTVG
jgi:hypothetical protein